MVIAFGLPINCAGVFFVPVAEHFEVGRGDIFLYVTIMNLTTAAVNLLIISLIRKCKLPVWLGIGGLLVSVSMGFWSVASALWQLYVAAVFQGIGNAMLGSVIINMILGNWFNERIGLATGITYSFSGIAGALLSPVFQSIITASSWQTAHNLCAIIAAALVVPSVILVTMDPRDKGYLPFGGEAQKAGTNVADAQNSSLTGKRRMIAILILMTAGFVTAFNTAMGSQHIKDFGVSVSLSAENAALLITGVMFGNIVSKLLFGIFSDKIGPKLTYLIFISIAIVGFGVLLFLYSIGFVLMIVAALMLGFTYSLGGVGNSQMTQAQFSRTESSKIYAWTQMSSQLGSSIGAASIGYIYDWTGGYSLSLGICLILSAVIALAVEFGLHEGKYEGLIWLKDHGKKIN